jgi:hypothetical protein
MAKMLIFDFKSVTQLSECITTFTYIREGSLWLGYERISDYAVGIEIIKKDGYHTAPFYSGFES